MAYLAGMFVGSIIGMVFIGAGFGWVIRRLAKLDYGISIGIAMIIIAFGAGFTNSSIERPYWSTVVLYLVAGIIAYFIVMAARRRELGSRLFKGIESTLGLTVGPTDAPIGPDVQRPTHGISPPKSILWARGFFRVWVVLSLVWATIMALAFGGSVLSPYVPSKAVATLQGSSLPQMFDTYGEPYRSWSSMASKGELTLTNLGGGYELYSPAGSTGPSLAVEIAVARKAVATYVATEMTSRRNGAMATLLGALAIPPLVVLVIGWLVGWAVSGFRRTT